MVYKNTYLYICVCVCVYIYIYIYICKYTHTIEYYSDTKTEWNNAICSNMDGLRDYHTTSEREKQIYGITHIYNLIFKKMIQMILLTKQK